MAEKRGSKYGKLLQMLLLASPFLVALLRCGSYQGILLPQEEPFFPGMARTPYRS